MLQPKGSRQEILRSPELKKLILRNSLIGAAIGVFIGIAGAAMWTKAKSIRDCEILRQTADCSGSFNSHELLISLPIGFVFASGLFALLAYRMTDVYLMFTYERRLKTSMLPPMTQNKELVDRFTRKK